MMVKLVDQTDDPEDELIGHMCIYLFDHEIHIDLESDGGVLDLELLANSCGQLVTAAILKQFTENTDANLGQSPEQRVH